ncbi:MAG: HAMP domain-containing histidine kinase [Rhodanobacteraceae bacterium]|nr:HAMP domain-containing histidine kinase [Rhodanobacteraceae bacterium]
MDHPRGIRRKIWAVFTLQLAAISCATLMGGFAAGIVLEDWLIRHVLKDEAHYLTQRLRLQPVVELLDTRTMRAYLDPAGEPGNALPADLQALNPGYHYLNRHGRDELVYIVDDRAGRLALTFNRGRVHEFTLVFALVLLTLILLIIYLITWLTYRASRRAVTPIVALARAVRDWDPKKPDLGVLDLAKLPASADRDAEALAGALHAFALRIEEFVERERNFTRDASHELRSPLTVIKVASDVLDDEEQLTPFARRSVGRIRAAARDMEALIEAFLILARESDLGLPEEDFLIDEVVDDEMERVRPLLDNKPVQLHLQREGSFRLHASPRVLSVMLGNLLRNACQFTEHGRILVTVGGDFVRVEDTGVGIRVGDLEKIFTPFFRPDRSPRGGHGVGLSIVKRLSDRFNWPLQLDSVLGAGTVATLRFPGAVPRQHETSRGDG